uniref:Claudin n=1 Tax=Acanthochromis polyacanthus TaxID=80966 RepID=A0A3Q1FRY9_9TELE
MSMGMEIVGIALGVLGFIIAIVTCALPMWRVSAFIGANIITAQTIWEGLWMNCVIQSTGQMQCKVYDSLLALPQELQASRAMTIISIILGVLGVLISIVGNAFNVTSPKKYNSLSQHDIHQCAADVDNWEVNKERSR